MTAVAQTDRRATAPLWMAPAQARLLEVSGIDSLDALFARHVGTSLSKSDLPPWRERIRISLPGSPKGDVYYLKRYRQPPLSHQMRRFIGGHPFASTAGIEWRWLRALETSGIAAARAIAFGQQMWGCWERRSAVLIAAVPGVSLEQMCTAAAGATPPSPVPRALLRAVADLVARFHRCGFVHRDLYAAHVFVQQRSPDDVTCHLIDLQRAIRPKWRRRRWLVKDLASLHYSIPTSAAGTRDRLRWLRYYARQTGETWLRPEMLRRIQGKARRIARHDRKRAGAVANAGSGRGMDKAS